MNLSDYVQTTDFALWRVSFQAVSGEYATTSPMRQASVLHRKSRHTDAMVRLTNRRRSALLSG